MNKIISIDEIMSLYKQCNVTSSDNQNVRTEINNGNLYNKLNDTFQLSNVSTVTFSNNSIIPSDGIHL